MKTSFTKLYKLEYSTKSEIQQKLRISVTDGCNFNCFFCHNEGQGAVSTSTGKMSVKEITKIVEIAVRSGIKFVKLTGGEPLIYKFGNSNIIDLVTAISSLRSNYKLDFTISLITNGYLLNKYAKKLKDAGLDSINISLPTLAQKSFQKIIQKGKTVSVERVIEGINEAVSASIKQVKVNMVLFQSTRNGEGNIYEISNMIKTCKQLKIDELRMYTLLWHEKFTDFIEYYQYWDSEVFSELDIINPDLSSNVKAQLLSDLRSFGNGWSSFVYPKVRMIVSCDGFPVAFETMMYGRFLKKVYCNNCEYYSSCQEGPYALRISADGMIRGCLLNKMSINLLQGIKRGKSTDKLIEVFKSSFTLLPY